MNTDEFNRFMKVTEDYISSKIRQADKAGEARFNDFVKSSFEYINKIKDEQKEEIMAYQKVMSVQFDDFMKGVSKHINTIRDEQHKIRLEQHKIREDQKDQVEKAVNAKLLEVIGLKWQSLIAILTALALYFAGFVFFSNLKLNAIRSDLFRLERTVEAEGKGTHKNEKEAVPNKTKKQH